MEDRDSMGRKKSGGRNDVEGQHQTLPMVRWTSNSTFLALRLLLCNFGPLVVLLPERSRYTFFLLALIVLRAEPLKEGKYRE